MMKMKDIKKKAEVEMPSWLFWFLIATLMMIFAIILRYR